MKAQPGKTNSSRHLESSKNYFNASSIWLLFKFCIFEYVSKFHRGFLSIFTFKKHHMRPKKSRKVLFNLYFILPRNLTVDCIHRSIYLSLSLFLPRRKSMVYTTCKQTHIVCLSAFLCVSGIVCG